MQNIDKFEHIVGIDPEKRVGEQVGHYRLIRWLGRGAFADVYLGEHIYLKMQSAIKILHMHLPEKAQKDFLNEACTIARLDHPNIVRIFDYGVENGNPFLVMAYAPNGSLRQRFPEGTCLSLEQVVPLVQQMALALGYAHEQGLIHRDVKPENMLIGAQNQVLLSDFGLVLVAQSMASLTANAMAGTVLYMAPEMLGGKVHFASDQYALGVVTYQWLCGQYPFTGSSSIQIGTQHLLAEPPSLCERVPNLPPAIEQAVFKALAKDRAQRYENVIAFANALQDAWKDVTSIPATISMSSSPFPLSERLPEPHEMPTIEPIEPDTNVLSEKPSSSELVSGVGPLSAAPLNADCSGKDIPFTRRTQLNRSKILGLVLLCFIIAASGTYAASSLLRTSQPERLVRPTQVVKQVLIPVQNSISPTQPATPTATAQPTPQVTTIPIVLPRPTPIPSPSPIVHQTTTVDDSIEGTGVNQFNYIGSGWNHCTGGCDGCCYDGTWSWDSTAGDYVTLSFTGIQIKFYIVVGPYGGIGAISVDGGSETMVNSYSTEAIGDQLAWTSPMLPAGNHTFKMRATGTKGDPSSQDSEAAFDRVDILS